ncbi:hemoglobin-like flavoprotein [Granulicella aggregans]|uniref:Hemoglobin-like flavoprotein n=1 Tax=Granulicella aggregans TaxID=474949 RepID=A0A7W7ZKJ3_9BACT|nr:hemoglobin-like flavoprotein [Granulicella aggregans]
MPAGEDEEAKEKERLLAARAFAWDVAYQELAAIMIDRESVMYVVALEHLQP